MKLLFLFFATALMVITGCSSPIHSDAVRELIDIEKSKTDAAKVATKKFTDETKKRVEILNAGLKNLEIGLSQLQASEHKHLIVFSSSQNLESKNGVDAYAAAYLIGITYLTEQAGLDQAVRDQFSKDINAFDEQAKRISESWDSLGTLQAEVQNYSNLSVLSSVDSKAVSAAISEIPGASHEFDNVLKDSQKVNDTLDSLLEFGPISNGSLGKLKPYSKELMDLLSRIKAAK